MNIRVDLNIIPLRKQVNVIWLSKVIKDLVLLEHESGISQAYITRILSNEEKIFNNWLKASSRRINGEIYQRRKESYECDVVDRILFEWTKRKTHNLKRTVQLYEVEYQANVIKQQLGVSKYSIESINFWNRDFNNEECLNDRHDGSLSLDTDDILEDMRYQIHLTTYTKFKNLLKKLDYNARIRSQSLSDFIDKEAEICIEISDEDDEITNGSEMENSDETKLFNIDPTTGKEEESGEELREDLNNVIPITEEALHDENVSTMEGNDDTYAINLTQESAENGVIRQEVIDILAELQKEIEAEAQCASPRAGEHAAGSDKASSPSKALNGAGQSMIPQTTDSIEELVQKYETYKGRQKNLQISEIHSRYQEFPEHCSIELDEMRNKMPNEFFLHEDNKLEVGINEEIKENIETDSNSCEYQGNLKLTLEKNQCEEETVPGTKTTLECCSYLAIKEEESFISEEGIYHIDKDNSNIKIKEEDPTPMTEYERKSKSPSKYSATKERMDILLDTPPINESALKQTRLDICQTTTSYEEDVQETFHNNVNEKTQSYTTFKDLGHSNIENAFQLTSVTFKGRRKSIANDVVDTNVHMVKTVSHKRRKLTSASDEVICIESQIENRKPLDNNVTENDSPSPFKNTTQFQKDTDMTILCLDVESDLEDEDFSCVESDEDDEHITLLEIVSDEEDVVPELNTNVNVTESRIEDRSVMDPEPLSLSVNPNLNKNRRDKFTTASEKNADCYVLPAVMDRNCVNLAEDSKYPLDNTSGSCTSNLSQFSVHEVSSELNTNIKATETQSRTEDDTVMVLNTNCEDNFTRVLGNGADFYVPPTVTDRNCSSFAVNSTESLENTNASCISNLSDYTIIELPNQESPEAPINASRIYKSKSRLHKKDFDTSLYLHKLKEFLVRNKDYEAFKIVVKLQMAFIP